MISKIINFIKEAKEHKRQKEKLEEYLSLLNYHGVSGRINSFSNVYQVDIYSKMKRLSENGEEIVDLIFIKLPAFSELHKAIENAVDVLSLTEAEELIVDIRNRETDKDSTTKTNKEHYSWEEYQ